MARGICYITHQLSPDQPLDAFHDWYDKEHAPARLALPFFLSGRRYKFGDSKSPEWMALYEVSDLDKLSDESYTSLTSKASANEKDIKQRVASDRAVYEQLYSRGSGPADGEAAPFIIALRRVFGDEAGASDEYAKWFEEEHVLLLEKIPGWLRSRTFRQKKEVGEAGKQYYLTMHEYTHLEDMIGTMQRTKGLKTDWKDKVDLLLEEKMVREWKYDHDFHE